MARAPLTMEIDKATDLVEAAGWDITPERVAANVRTTPDEGTTLQKQALVAAVERRLKQQGKIIVDSAPRPGGRPRGDYYGTGLAEHKEQLRIQAENGRYTQNRIRAEQAVIDLVEAEERRLGYEPPLVMVADDIDRIYRMNGCTPPKRVAV